jgi:pentatricopeptide repeat protein
MCAMLVGGWRRGPTCCGLVVRQGVRPDVVSYNTVISCLAKASGRHRVDQAEEVFRQMVRQGVRPDVKTFGALIEGHARAGDLANVRTPLPSRTHQSTLYQVIYMVCACRGADWNR